MLAPLTKPEQPLKNAAEVLKINTPTAHTHPLRLFFTLFSSSGLGVSSLTGAGWGPRKWLLCLARTRVKDKEILLL
jgi:hypothetical protein